MLIFELIVIPLLIGLLVYTVGESKKPETGFLISTKRAGLLTTGIITFSIGLILFMNFDRSNKMINLLAENNISTDQSDIRKLIQDRQIELIQEKAKDEFLKRENNISHSSITISGPRGGLVHIGGFR